MAKYDFSALSDKEFEEFVCELLNEEYHLQLQSFRKGKDKGVDLRYSTSENANRVVVQVKQYYTNFRTLQRSLTAELEKVKLIRPGEYWVVTTLPLNATEKDRVFELFREFMPSPNYVLGVEDLNRLLARHPKVERNWLKLWLTHPAMLERLVSRAIHGRSHFYQEKINERLQLYVRNQSFFDANKILQDHRFLLISGQPGVGKTTLADILVYELLADDFELLYIDSDIEEAAEVFEQNLSCKQVIYFDDFLGANHLELLSRGSRESALVRFIERVQTSKNKYLILTTRTTILRNAKETYEKLNRATLELNNRELRLEDYSLEDKARILYSHLFRSKISDEYKQQVFHSQNYWQIIRHKNYAPRLIEFFTSPYNLSLVAPEGYLKFMIDHLDNPHQVWRHSFLQQLQQADRLLVFALYSFGTRFNLGGVDFSNAIPKAYLQQAFDSRLYLEVNENGFTRPIDAFNMSLRRLLDGYISSVIVAAETQPRLRFINPSISDFLTHYLRESEEERWKLIRSAVYVDQLLELQRIIDFDGQEFDSYVNETTRFIDFVWQKRDELRATIHLDEREPAEERFARRCEVISLLHDIGRISEFTPLVNPLINELFTSIPFAELNTACLELIIPVLLESDDDSMVRTQISSRWEELMVKLWEPGSHNSDRFDQIEDLFRSYNKSIPEFSQVDSHRKLMLRQLVSYQDDQTFSEIMDAADDLTSEEDVEPFIERMNADRAKFFLKFNLDDPGYSDYGEIDVEYNLLNKSKRKEERAKLATENPNVKRIQDQKAMEESINDLFSSMPIRSES